MLQKILNGGLIALLIAATTLWLNECKRNNKENDRLLSQLKDKDNKIQELHDYYLEWIENCENAIIRKDSIVYVDRWYPGEVVEVPAAIDSIEVAKEVNKKLFIKNYRAEYAFDDLTINYHIKTYGDLLEFGLESYKLNVETHHNTAVITKPSLASDPITEYRYRKGPFIAIGIMNDMSSWTSWSGVEGEIGWMTRKGISFGVGYQHLVIKQNSINLYENLAKFRLAYFFGKN